MTSWLVSSDGKQLGSYFCGDSRHHRLIDWDGDGFDSPGVFRPSNAILYLKNANTNGFADVYIPGYGMGRINTADRLGAYGYRARPVSPHVDALARDGIVFEHATANGPRDYQAPISGQERIEGQAASQSSRIVHCRRRGLSAAGCTIFPDAARTRRRLC